MIIRDELKNAIPQWELFAPHVSEKEFEGLKLVDHTPEELSLLIIFLSNVIAGLKQQIAKEKSTDATAEQ